MTETTHAWCQDCGRIVRLEEPEAFVKNDDGKFVGRDLVCEQHHIIATVFNEVNNV